MIDRASSGGSPTTPIALAALFAFLVGVCPAHADAIQLVWDPSPDPTVIGYLVHVGTTSGFYTQTFDVGKVTSFTYNAGEQRAYYFAVAAYAAGPSVGRLSGEVSTGPGATVPSASEISSAANFWTLLWRTQAQATRLSRPAACWTPAPADCVTVQTLAVAYAPVSSVAATDDGRLFFVEGGRRIRLVTPSGPASESVLVESDPSITLNEVVIDPAFTDTGLLWVSETATSSDGRREFSVARYRVVQNRAGERTVVVPGINVPRNENAFFSLDAARNIYIAVPGSRTASSDVYAGTVLGFNAEGAALGNSPIIASGYSSPTGITVDSARGGLWLTGFDGASAAATSFINLQQSAPSIGTVLTGWRSSLSVGREGLLFAVNDQGLVLRTTVGTKAASTQALTLASDQQAMSVTTAYAGQTYVSVRFINDSDNGAFFIQRLVPAP